jgi:glutamine amidotransferase
MQRVAVIDYGGSNLRSVAKALEFVAGGRHDIVVTDKRDVILDADRVVFPGQGAIGDCMQRLVQRDLTSVLHECIASRPFLGICLGLQSLMTDSDEDGGVECLGAYPGHVRRFPLEPGPAPDGSLRKIPHMGWNEVVWTKPHPLTDGVPSGTRFYFVHSYYVVPEDDAIVMGRTDYVGPFVSAVATGNVFAVQFHPEKSARGGLKLLESFLTWKAGE